jgi:rare lipoprotein A
MINTSIIQYIDRGTMRASWYGPRFHGRLTANGEIYDQNAYTAAHKSLSFGTLLRITNPRTNKSVIVRINDRGPYIPGRQIDLSKAVAEELDVISNGVKKLKIEEIVIEGIDNPLVSMN